jgi:hypothetical protein
MYDGWYKSCASNFFLRKCNFNNNEIYLDDSYIFCNYEALLSQIFHNFQHTFASISKMLFTSGVKFPALTSEHIMCGTRKL